MKVITINEENHGYIGIAKDYYSAISFLINDYWLTADYEIYNEDRGNWVRICECLGEDWVDKILSWDIENFNEVFGIGYINLTEEEVIEYTREG